MYVYHIFIILLLLCIFIVVAVIIFIIIIIIMFVFIVVVGLPSPFSNLKHPGHLEAQSATHLIAPTSPKIDLAY